MDSLCICELENVFLSERDPCADRIICSMAFLMDEATHTQLHTETLKNQVTRTQIQGTEAQ